MKQHYNTFIDVFSNEEKVQPGNDQEKAQSERNSYYKNRGGIN